MEAVGWQRPIQSDTFFWGCFLSNNLEYLDLYADNNQFSSLVLPPSVCRVLKIGCSPVVAVSQIWCAVSRECWLLLPSCLSRGRTEVQPSLLLTWIMHLPPLWKSMYGRNWHQLSRGTPLNHCMIKTYLAQQWKGLSECPNYFDLQLVKEFLDQKYDLNGSALFTLWTTQSFLIPVVQQL